MSNVREAESGVEATPGDLIRDFFDGVATRVDRSKLVDVRESYGFVIEGTGSWTIRVNDGDVAVEAGAAAGDCVLRASPELFLGIVSGEQNPLVAFMSGDLKIDGDICAAMKLQHVL